MAFTDILASIEKWAPIVQERMGPYYAEYANFINEELTPFVWREGGQDWHEQFRQKAEMLAAADGHLNLLETGIAEALRQLTLYRDVNAAISVLQIASSPTLRLKEKLRTLMKEPGEQDPPT